MVSVKKRVEVPIPAHDRVMQLVCYGPSLRRTWGQIDRTKDIATVSGAHDFLRRKGIVPNYHVELDWRPHKALHITDPTNETLFWLASCVHPNVVRKVPDPALWHAKQTDAEIIYITARENTHLIAGGGSAGLRAIELFYARGYRRFEIHGMDSSFEERQWAGPHHGQSQLKRKVIEVPLAGRKFKTSVAFLMYADQFNACKKARPDIRFILHGDGLIQTMHNMEMAA